MKRKEIRMSESMTANQTVDKATSIHILSDEFRVVADRIQEELALIPSQPIGSLELEQVEVAEQVLDKRALELQHGSNAREAWFVALSDYEIAWMKVIKSLGERRN